MTSRKTFVSRSWLEAIKAVLEMQPEILFAMLYGSATETPKFRDLDVGLYVDREQVPASAEIDYAFNLAERLTEQIAYPVDVRVINNAPLGFRYNVSRGQALVINHSEIYYHFLERTWDEYFDFEPIARQYLRGRL